MSNQVDHYGQPADRFHPEYDSFTAWLDAEAPPEPVIKRNNLPRHYTRRNAVTLDGLKASR